MVHMITLIHGEMTRSKESKKAASWSGKYTDAIQSILMVMGELQFTDIHVLATFNFFNMYSKKGKKMSDNVKAEYSDQLYQRSKNMLTYINDVCVNNPKLNKTKITEEEKVAKMIGVSTNKALYSTKFVNVNKEDFSTMVSDSREKFTAVFGGTFRINSMSKNIWYDLLNYPETSKDL